MNLSTSNGLTLPLAIAALVLLAGVLALLRLNRLEESRRKAIQQAQGRTAAHYAMARSFTDASSVTEVVGCVFTHARNAMNAGAVLIAIVEGDTIGGLASQGIDADAWSSLAVPVDDRQHPLAELVRTRETSVEEGDGKSGNVWFNSLGFAAHASVPLVAAGAVTGTLTVGFQRPTRFDEEDLRFLAALGDETATALSRARYLERLKELDREKDEFVSIVSHELRGPLTAVKGFASLISEGHTGELNERQVEYLEVILRNTERMFVLIEDLLTIARVESGRIDMEFAPEPYAEVVEGIVASVEPAVAERDLELDVQAEDVGTVEMDRMRIEQVLSNVISNAVKYSPENGTIRLHVFPENEGVTTEVTDSGPGIPEQDQPRIFEKFFRATTPTREKIPGTGLGLAISKAIVDKHGGSIWFVSKPGEGTTMSFWIPSRPR